MACLDRLSTWLTTKTDNITDPFQFSAFWDLDKIIFFNGTREDLVRIVHEWRISGLLLSSYAMALIVSFTIVLGGKVYLEYILNKEKSVATRITTLCSYKGLTRPWLLKSGDKIFLLHYIGVVALYNVWIVGAGSCTSTRKLSTLYYAIAIGSQYHVTSLYVMLVKVIVASSVAIMGKVEQSNFDMFFMVVIPWLLVFYAFIDIAGAIQIRHSIDQVRVCLIWLLAPTAVTGISMYLFGKKATRTISDALRSASGAGGSTQLNGVRQRVKLMSSFVVGASFSVISIQLVLVLSEIMNIPLVSLVLLVYLTAVFLLYANFGLVLELKRISGLLSENKYRKRRVTCATRIVSTKEPSLAASTR